jgi:propionyl-CoA carboxylase alpha chain
VSVSVAEGDEVKAGDELAVLEAMKMENALRAERNGVVTKLNFATGQTVEVDDVILELE